MSRDNQHFVLPARVLHWLMAALILAMFFIGIGMVSTVTDSYTTLLALHRPIGLAILALVVIRLIIRLRNKPPALPASVPPAQKAIAELSHYGLYVLMFALPLVGWAMQSAGGYPVQVTKSFYLPPILPHDGVVYGWLRLLHSVLAYAFMLLVLGHLVAALIHGFIRRDGVLQSMTGGEVPKE